jgi:hypothetical protein
VSVSQVAPDHLLLLSADQTHNVVLLDRATHGHGRDRFLRCGLPFGDPFEARPNHSDNVEQVGHIYRIILDVRGNYFGSAFGKVFGIKAIYHLGTQLSPLIRTRCNTRCASIKPDLIQSDPSS